MKRVLPLFLCLALAGCFRESRQPRLTVTALPSVLVRLADEQTIAMALIRVATHNDLTLGLPESAQGEFFEVAGSGKTEPKDFTAEPFVVGFDGSHFWLLATGQRELRLDANNQGGQRAMKTLATRPTYAQFFATRLLAEAESALDRQQFDAARHLAQAARGFASAEKTTTLLATIDQRQAEGLLQTGEQARFRKDYRTARACAQQAAVILPGSATGLTQRVLEDEGGELRIFTGHQGAVTSVAFSPDGKFALSGSEDKTVRVWDVAAGKEVRTLTTHRAAVRGVAFSPDGRQVLSGGDDGFMKLLDVATGK